MAGGHAVVAASSLLSLLLLPLLLLPLLLLLLLLLGLGMFPAVVFLVEDGVQETVLCRGHVFL